MTTERGLGRDPAHGVVRSPRPVAVVSRTTPPEKPVRNHPSRLLAELGVERRIQAAVIATQVKIFGRHDNEWGYTNRLLDLTEYVATRLPWN